MKLLSANAFNLVKATIHLVKGLLFTSNDEFFWHTGKGEDTTYQYFLLLPHYLPKLPLSMSVNPLPDDKILDRSKLKRSADDNFKFDENSRKFSKWVENSMGKGEIARYEQFLLFLQCFQKTCFPGVSKGVIV